MTHYLFALLILGLAGTLLGFILGTSIQAALWNFLKELFPARAAWSVTGAAVFEGLMVGIAGVALFTVIPISRLHSVGPMVIFRKEGGASPLGPAARICGALIVLFFGAMVIRQIGQIRLGLYFMGAVALLLLASAGASFLLLKLLSRIRSAGPAFRQAARGMNRPGNATLFTLLALCSALTVLLTIHLAEKNLDAAYVDSYPKDSANLFFLDIQPDQLQAFKKELGLPALYFPSIRARVHKINGQAINISAEQKKSRDSLARTFTLTWSRELHPGESLVQGKSLFQPGVKEPQVSILDMVQDISPIKMGDRITFNIQGVPLTATVVSVRKREKVAISPFFYFLFPKSVLDKAPATWVTAVGVDAGRIPELQRKMAAQFPNVTSVDVTQTLAVAAGILKKLSFTIRFFTLLSLTAGLLILVSGALATRAQRIREAVYFKILGATGGFVLKIVVLESLLTALSAAVVALLFSNLMVFLMCRYYFNLPFHPFLGQALTGALAMVTLVTLAGVAASGAVIREKPARFLANDVQ